MLDEMNERISRVRAVASQRGFAGLLVIGRAADRAGDLLYLCGHMPMLAGHVSRYAIRGRGLGGLYVPADRRIAPTLAVTTPFYMQSPNVKDVVVNPNFAAGVTAILEKHGARNNTVGLVGMDVVPAAVFDQIARQNVTVRFVEADDVVMNMRAVKSARELISLRKGSQMADEVAELVKERIKPGVTEQELASFVISEMGKRGATTPFATCQSGVARSGEPFLFPPVTQRKLEDGDLLHMEINGRCDGYMIDICRSTVVGKASKGGVDLLETVLAMLEQSIAAIKPGIMAEELEAIAEDVASKAGFANKFAFGYGGAGTYLGHGIGLGVDEPPAICRGEKTLLQAGMVLTIEPGLYRTSVGGARIEDEVLVTDTGAEVITKCSRTWWK